MSFDDRYALPRLGHELTSLGSTSGISWCIRCGALWLDAQPGVRRGTWEAPGQGGRSRSTFVAPACRASTAPGADNPAANAQLMLLALTHGWRCEPIALPGPENEKAWRWSRDGILGGESWSVSGAWEDGPVVNESVRRLLMTTMG